MARKLIECSEIEKICLYYEVRTGRMDYKSAYKMIKGLPLDKDMDDSKISQYYKWLKGNRIQGYIKSVRGEMDLEEEKLKAEMRKKLIKENALENLDISLVDGATNFRDREQMLNWLNIQINKVDDESIRVKYLGMINDLQNFKADNNKDKIREVQRFYTQIQCRECKMYLEQAKKMGIEVPHANPAGIDEENEEEN